MKTALDFMNLFQDDMYDLYMVGGAVRDMILGHEPKDIDFSTPMLPNEVQTRLKNIGIRKSDIDMKQAHYGVLVVNFAGEEFEITTFHKETYTDSRKPKVEFTTSLQEDLYRRDFNINSVAWDGLKFYGSQDFSEIRPNKPWSTLLDEDGLRLIRAIRFSVDKDIPIDWGDRMFGYGLSHYMVTVSPQKFYEECIKAENQLKFYAEVMGLGIQQYVIPFGWKKRYPERVRDNQSPFENFSSVVWEVLYEPGRNKTNLIQFMKSMTMMGFSNKQKEDALKFIREEYNVQ